MGHSPHMCPSSRSPGMKTKWVTELKVVTERVQWLQCSSMVFKLFLNKIFWPHRKLFLGHLPIWLDCFAISMVWGLKLLIKTQTLALVLRIIEFLDVSNMHVQIPGVGLPKYRHQASHRNCPGTPSTLFGCIQQDPPTTPVLCKTPLQSFIVNTLVTLSMPSRESCTIIKILHTVHLKNVYHPLSVFLFL